MRVNLAAVVSEFRFARTLIDHAKQGIYDTVIYRDRLCRVTAGSYGHCEDYPTGFTVDLELLNNPGSPAK